MFCQSTRALWLRIFATRSGNGRLQPNKWAKRTFSGQKCPTKGGTRDKGWAAVNSKSTKTNKMQRLRAKCILTWCKCCENCIEHATSGHQDHDRQYIFTTSSPIFFSPRFALRPFYVASHHKCKVCPCHTITHVYIYYKINCNVTFIRD